MAPVSHASSLPITLLRRLLRYYAATANPSPDYPELEGEVGAGVCVVGAGFTGLSVALNLVERGYDVVVLEGARVGWGASGRNGGQIVSGFAAAVEKIADWVGAEDARRLWNMAVMSSGRHRRVCRVAGFIIYAGYIPPNMSRATARTSRPQGKGQP